MLWQVQDAKQRFSELLRVAHLDGPQFATRHGREVAVIIDIADYRHLTLVTRNATDLSRCGVMLLNPFEPRAGR